MKHWISTAAVLAAAASLSLGCAHKGHAEHAKMECKDCSMEDMKGKGEGKHGEGKYGQGKHAEMKLTDLPAPVQAAVATALAAYPGAKVEEIKKEDEDGKTAYEIGFETADDVDHSLKIAPDGTLLEEETEVELTAVPPAVTAGVKAKYATGKIEEAWLVKEAGKSFYELEVKAGDAKHELKVSAEGTILEDETMKAEKNENDEKDEKGK